MEKEKDVEKETKEEEKMRAWGLRKEEKEILLGLIYFFVAVAGAIYGL